MQFISLSVDENIHLLFLPNKWHAHPEQQACLHKLHKKSKWVTLIILEKFAADDEEKHVV